MELEWESANIEPLGSRTACPLTYRVTLVQEVAVKNFLGHFKIIKTLENGQTEKESTAFISATGHQVTEG